MDRAQMLRDNKLLVNLISEAADENSVVPQEVTVRQFKQVALQLLKDDDRLELAQRVSKMSAGRFNAFRDAHVNAEIGGVQIESEDNRLRARDARADTRGKTRDQVFIENLTGALSTVFNQVVFKPSPYVPRKEKGRDPRSPITREVTILLSDLHYGADLDGREVPLPYGKHEEARRTAAICQQVAEYKRPHRNETRLNINIGGDIVQGKLHDTQDSRCMSEQIASAGHYLFQAITFLAAQYPEVVVRCIPGNHDRDLLRHAKRATTQKWDSTLTSLFFMLKLACDQFKRANPKTANVRFEIPYTPYVAYQSFDKWVFGTHGDTVLNVGYPGNSINVKAIENQVNKINAAAMTNEGHRYDLFWVGHVHFGTNIRLSNGCVVVTNPALIPPDGYAVSLGSLESSCGQSLWESVAGYAMGDYRLLHVDKHTDNDASLEKIIRPFDGFAS